MPGPSLGTLYPLLPPPPTTLGVAVVLTASTGHGGVLSVRPGYLCPRLGVKPGARVHASCFLVQKLTIGLSPGAHVRGQVSHTAGPVAGCAPCNFGRPLTVEPYQYWRSRSAPTVWPLTLSPILIQITSSARNRAYMVQSCVLTLVHRVPALEALHGLCTAP